MRRLSIFLLTVAAVACAMSPVAAQIRLGDQLRGPNRSPLSGLEGDDVFADPVQLSAQFTGPKGVKPATLMITASIAPGWHVYSISQPPGGPTKTRIELTPSPQYKLAGEFRSEPEATARVDQEAWPGLTIEEHADRVTWYAPVELAAGTDPQSLTIAGEVRMLACKESCIPVNKEFTARLGFGVPGVTIGSAPSELASTNGKPIAVGASFQPEGSEVKVAGRIVPSGSNRAMLDISLTPAANWHIYAYADRDDQPGSKPTLLALNESIPFTASRPATAAAVTTDSSVPEFGTMRYHNGAVTWQIALELPPNLPPGEYPLSGVVGYQACESRDDGMGSCELPRAARFATSLRVGPGGEVTAEPFAFTPATYKEAADTAARWAAHWTGSTAVAETDSHTPSPSAAKGSSSLVLILGAALLGGLILNVMPCVLPVIGLKVLAFAEQGGESRRRIFLLNLAYAGGLIGVFLLLATLASLVQLGVSQESFGWGELYTLLWFKVAMTVLVFAMALSFLGVWELPIPGFAGTGTAARLATREGYAGAVFKGIFTTILATPCSGPFLGPVFGYTIAQPPWVTYLIFLFVGLGMAAPYLLIGAFPSLIRHLPRPGAWMETFKQLMGFVLLGTVVYLLSTVGAEYVIPTLTLLVGVWFACWWVGRTELTASDAARRTAWIGGWATAAVVGVLAFRLMAPSEHELPWQPFSPAALAQARDEGKTVLVDFTADWCLTCKTNLKFALNREEVRKLVDKNDVVTLVADWTDGNPIIKQALAELGSRSIPLLAVYPADRAKEVIVLPDVVTPGEVVEALRTAGPSRMTAGGMAEITSAATPLN